MERGNPHLENRHGVQAPRYQTKHRKNSKLCLVMINLRFKSQLKKEFYMRTISLHRRAKIAVVITLGSLFAPIAAQAGSPGTYTGNGTVSFGLTECQPMSDSFNTSVAARSVVLYSDTASAVANTDGSTYIYFTQKDINEWGAQYNYGSIQNLATCDAEEMTGTVTITRGRFMASSGGSILPAVSETTTNTVDFIQYVGNTKLTGVNGGSYKGNPCGNMNHPSRNANVTQPCSSGILADFSQLTQSGSVAWRDGSQKTGVNGNQSSNAYVVVKVRKAAIAAAPSGTSFVATETYTVTSV
jgi:hypothetical protein